METKQEDWFVSLPSEERHTKFLHDVIELLLKEAVFKGTHRSNPVVRWRDPEKQSVLLNLVPSEKPATHDELLQAIQDTITYSVKTGHPYFINQLFSSLDPYGLAGQWVTDALNPSVYTYEVAPVFSVMETAVLKEMLNLVGFPNGEGMFCPGGSIANGTAMNIARFKMFPNIKRDGLACAPKLVLFSSEDAHYSVHKMAAFLGLGESNVCLIQTDKSGCMDTLHLEAQIQETLSSGVVPFMVVATAGTTVLGAFDPLPDIADICEKNKLWLHVDAAWGGGILLSKTHRHKLKGLERSDSVVWNPHKLLAVPQQCSVLLVRHEGILKACHSQNAAYLFQKDKFYDTTYDTGDKYLQCGRRADVFKFWLMWKAKGTSGFEKHVDSIMDTARYMTAAIKLRSSFKSVMEPEFVNVCFWYIPQNLQGSQEKPDFNEKLHKVAPRLKELMMRKGSMMLTYQPLRGLPNFFRFVLQNSGVTHQDVDYFLDELECLGENL